MTEWIATGLAALDVSGSDSIQGDVDIAVVAPETFELVGLNGASAELYRRLIYGPVPFDSVSGAELDLLRHFANAGLASTMLSHPNQIEFLNPPWQISVFHELAYGVLSSIARNKNIPILFIKGPMLASQGIRSREHSGDIDILINPKDILRFEDCLLGSGWTKRNSIWNDTGINHSQTFSSDLPWACEVDLHEHFPGIGISATDAFEFLLDNSLEIEFAGVRGRTLSVDAHVIIYALHVLRPRMGYSLASEQIDSAVRALLISEKNIHYLIRSLDCSGALWPALDVAFPERYETESRMPPENWRWRQNKSIISGYISAIRMVPMHNRMRLVKNMIWPDKAILLDSDKNAGYESGSLLIAHFRRYCRGFKALAIQLREYFDEKRTE